MIALLVPVATPARAADSSAPLGAVKVEATAAQEAEGSAGAETSPSPPVPPPDVPPESPGAAHVSAGAPRLGSKCESCLRQIFGHGQPEQVTHDWVHQCHNKTRLCVIGTLTGHGA